LRRRLAALSPSTTSRRRRPAAYGSAYGRWAWTTKGDESRRRRHFAHAGRGEQSWWDRGRLSMAAAISRKDMKFILSQVPFLCDTSTAAFLPPLCVNASSIAHRSTVWRMIALLFPPRVAAAWCPSPLSRLLVSLLLALEHCAATFACAPASSGGGRATGGGSMPAPSCTAPHLPKRRALANAGRRQAPLRKTDRVCGTAAFVRGHSVARGVRKGSGGACCRAGTRALAQSFCPSACACLLSALRDSGCSLLQLSAVAPGVAAVGVHRCLVYAG